MNSNQLTTRFSAKQAAAYFGLTADALRFYERKGIIPPVKRDQNGYRVFTDVEMNWLYLAVSLRHAGLSLEKITEFVKLMRQRGQDTTEAQKAILIEQIRTINKRMNQIKETRKVLEAKLDHFDQCFGEMNSLSPDQWQQEWKKYRQ